MTPLPLPERPSSKLTWIEYSPFFMVFPTRPSRVAERRRHCARRPAQRQRDRLAICVISRATGSNLCPGRDAALLQRCFAEPGPYGTPVLVAAPALQRTTP